MGIHKIMALGDAKHEEHLKTLDIVNFHDQFESTMVKWKKTSTVVMAIIYSHHYKDNHVFKDKWTIVFGDYCMIKDYKDTTSINEDYWVLSIQNMSFLDLLKQYVKKIYETIEYFLSSQPIFCPHHVQDLMATND